jgi:hypothetical protein
MSQAGYTPISIYSSNTASAVPSASNLVQGELAINNNDGKLFYKDSSGVVQTIAYKNVPLSTVTGTLPVANGGTNGTATPTSGAVAYGTGTAYAFTSAGTAGQVLQSNGSGAPTWATPSGGGATLSNDTSTTSNLYPMFAAATSGVPTTVYTSNAKYLYKPSTGELQASQMVASNGIFVNNATVSSSYTVASGYNAMSVGPITVASGQSVTVSSGQRWVVL